LYSSADHYALSGLAKHNLRDYYEAKVRAAVSQAFCESEATALSKP
jgi:hypothetical protein